MRASIALSSAIATFAACIPDSYCPDMPCNPNDSLCAFCNQSTECQVNGAFVTGCAIQGDTCFNFYQIVGQTTLVIPISDPKHQYGEVAVQTDRAATIDVRFDGVRATCQSDAIPDAGWAEARCPISPNAHRLEITFTPAVSGQEVSVQIDRIDTTCEASLNQPCNASFFTQ